MITNPTLSTQVINHFGEAHQVLKCLEELQELSLELVETIIGVNNSDMFHLTKVIRNGCENLALLRDKIHSSEIRYDGIQKSRILYEMADVLITLNQMLVIFDKEGKVLGAVEEKETRLKRMLVNEEHERACKGVKI